MARDSFIFYRSFYEAIKEIEENEQLQVYKAISVYALEQEEIELTGVAKAIFSLVKPQLDANYKKYENGKQSKSKSEAKDKQSKSKTETNVNDNENVNVNEKEIQKKKTFEDVFSENQFSKKLEAAIRDFIDMRKAIKKPMTTKALELLIRNLKKLTNLEDEQIAILNQSIEHSWQTVYPLKSNSAKVSGNTKHEQREYTDIEFNQFYANR